MAVTIEQRGETLIAMAHGRIDGTNAEAFQDELTTAIAGNDHSLIIDLGGLSYIRKPLKKHSELQRKPKSWWGA